MMWIYAFTIICTVFQCSEVPDSSPNSAPTLIESHSHNNTNLVILPTSYLIPLQDQPNNFLPEHQFPIVSIQDGQLRGFTMQTIAGKDIKAFQGIPFAQPPIGDLRFKAPQKNHPWVGVRDAIAESPSCIQTDYIQQYKLIGTEDCLYLNVYRPSSSKSRQGLPVMIFIHGGGFFFGSSNLYGPSYLLEQDVILVSMNYRLGPLGFLSTGDEASPGNNGLKDQVLAMQWVQDNIAAFGGDPNCVTIFGESAGAGSVHFHMLSPLSRGLFHRAISESGCALCFWSISERAVEISKKFGSALNCTGTSTEMVQCLQTKDAALLVGTQLTFLEWTMYPVVIFGPVVEPSHDGSFLEQLPEDIYKQNGVANVPWITGFNADEGSINIATLFLINSSIPELNSQWDNFGPIFLELKHSADNYVEVTNNVRQHYLGDKPISFETRVKTSEMFSDRYTIACGVKAMKYHAHFSGQPVYGYYLSYRGKYSVVQLLGQKPQDWGVTHLDDLIYLFNNTAYYSTLKVTDEEYKISSIITSLWANFAATGEPLLTTSNGLRQKIWNNIQTGPGSSLEYLDINLSPKMIPDPFLERTQFWSKVHLINE